MHYSKPLPSLKKLLSMSSFAIDHIAKYVNLNV